MEVKLAKELKAGRIAGPYDERPFPNLRLSPIGVVAKKSSPGWRMIHHLSYPLGNSVNSHIDPELATVQYTSFDKVLDTISKLGRGAELAKMDVVAAFRLLILHPDEFDLFGFYFKNKFYYDKCLPMGCSASCAIFEKFSCFLEWVVKFKSGKNSIEHYLDDFLLAGAGGSGECLQLMEHFRLICGDIGVPLAEEKTSGPSCIMTFLGLEIDTLKMVIRIPQEKLFDLKAKLEDVLCMTKITLRDLQSLCGSLNFCARAIPSARAFNRRFFDAMSGITNLNHFIRVSVGMKQDIETWLEFLEKFNGTCAFGEIEWFTNSQLNLFTDSAGNHELGCGIYLSGSWSYFQWPEHWNNPDIMSDITFLELVPIVLSLFLFKVEFLNKRILFHTDNKALVSIINKKSSKSKRVMELIRPFVLRTMLYNMQFKAVHIEGRINCIADAISRQQWQRFRTLAPEAKAEKLPIPQDFLHLISELKLIV